MPIVFDPPGGVRPVVIRDASSGADVTTGRDCGFGASHHLRAEAMP